MTTTRVNAVIVAALLSFLPVLFTHGVIAGEPAKPEIIQQMESHAAESKVAFLLRVAAYLSAWSSKSGEEACGSIAQRDGRYSVILGTLHSQIMCDSVFIYTGWMTTGETIHSHPPTNATGEIILSARTKELANGALDGRTSIKAKRHAFSAGDYKSGPGYLVDNGELLYQHGAGTQEEIARLPVH